MSFKLEKVEELPKSKRDRVAVYGDIIKAIKEKEAGNYEVTVPNTKPKTLRAALNKLVKDEKNLKVSIRKDRIFLVKS